jgi:hypothetical protein
MRCFPGALNANGSAHSLLDLFRNTYCTRVTRFLLALASLPRNTAKSLGSDSEADQAGLPNRVSVKWHYKDPFYYLFKFRKA